MSPSLSLHAYQVCITYSTVVQMVHEDNNLYSVQEMADLLFGNTSATACYASHRLLSQERVFFKQAGRSPPRFQARCEKDVRSIQLKRAADEQVHASYRLHLQLQLLTPYT